jgi:hypothetical protein
MRYLGLVRTAENQGAPPPALMEAMDKFIAESLKDGSLVQTGGLAATSAGIRIRQSGGILRRTDGPFSEAKEVVGGYAILEAPSRSAAMDIMGRFMQLHEKNWPSWEGECELREITFVAP